MPTERPGNSERARLRQQALARWDDEGGASAVEAFAEGGSGQVPPLTNAELVQLQIRVIALENLVIALLADASDAPRELARDIAALISPRPGFTQHRLTLHAVGQMRHLLDRAELLG